MSIQDNHGRFGVALSGTDGRKEPGCTTADDQEVAENDIGHLAKIFRALRWEV